MCYHWVNGNKVHVSKTIMSILIGDQVYIPNICTFGEKNQKLKENTYVRDLWTIIIVKKSLINIWLGFLKKIFHKKYIFWYYITYWITRDNLEWNLVWVVQFSTIIVNHLFIFLNLKSSLLKMGVLLIKNNYIDVFKIKLLICNQLLIANLINFITCYRCKKKGYWI